MKKIVRGVLTVRLGLALALGCLCAGAGQAQDLSRPPTYGSVKLRAGFLPDPYTKGIVAGGATQTNLGGVTAWVATAPDFQLFYEAGNEVLTFHVAAGEDTTLLINLPDGTWVANDDGAGNLNPMIRLPQPQSGRYDIWVGTFNQNASPQSTLYITELK